MPTRDGIKPCIICNKDICKCPTIDRGSFAKYVKRDVIREGIAGRYCYEAFGSLLSYIVNEFGEDDSRVVSSYKFADNEIINLHSQGVVLKVDREFPYIPLRLNREITSAVIDYKKKIEKAGYVATESIVEEEL